MAAGKYDMYIEQGATYELNVTVDSSIDLGDYTARGQIRETACSSAILVSFTCTIVSSSQLTISLTPAQTSALKACGKCYQDITVGYYDIEIENTTDGSVIRLLNGMVSISPEVTR
jgi:hypothetical protein